MSSMNPDAQAIADILAYDDTTADFFREELAGLPQPRDSDLASLSTLATNNTARSAGGSFYSLRRFSSRVSIAESVDLDGERHFTLPQLCDFIARHESLKTAVIVSCSCYAVPMQFLWIPHRFLIFQLRRNGRRDVWMRLDRRPSSTVGPSALALASGVTPSNDSAQLASSLDDLLPPKASHENKIAFTEPCLLGQLRLTLLDLTVVMNKYKLNSENCWAFCALLQTDLFQMFKAGFEKGDFHHTSLARKASQRLSSHRRIALILSPHDPSRYQPMSTLLGLCATGPRAKYWQIFLFEAMDIARRWEGLGDFSSPEGHKWASKLLSTMSFVSDDVEVYQDFGFQLGSQLVLFCRQFTLSGRGAWARVDRDAVRCCVVVFHRHEQQHLESARRNLHEALQLFEEATSLLVPAVVENKLACHLQYDYAAALHNLGRADEARGVVINFIECLRRSGSGIGRYRGQMRDISDRGIWPPEFDYVLALQEGDLPQWTFWRQNQFQHPASISSPPSVPLPPLISITPTSSDDTTTSTHSSPIPPPSSSPSSHSRSPASIELNLRDECSETTSEHAGGDWSG